MYGYYFVRFSFSYARMKIRPVSRCVSSPNGYDGDELASPVHKRPEQLSVKVHYYGYYVVKMASEWMTAFFTTIIDYFARFSCEESHG